MAVETQPKLKGKRKCKGKCKGKNGVNAAISF